MGHLVSRIPIGCWKDQSEPSKSSMTPLISSLGNIQMKPPIFIGVCGWGLCFVNCEKVLVRFLLPIQTDFRPLSSCWLESCFRSISNSSQHRISRAYKLLPDRNGITLDIWYHANLMCPDFLQGLRENYNNNGRAARRRIRSTGTFFMAWKQRKWKNLLKNLCPLPPKKKNCLEFKVCNGRTFFVPSDTFSFSLSKSKQLSI